MKTFWGTFFIIIFIILSLFNYGNGQGIAPRQHLNADSIGYIPYSYTATGVFKYIPLKGFLTDSVSIGAESINDLTDGKSNETNNLFLGTNAGVSASSTRSTGVGLNSLAVSTGADNNGFGYNAGTLIGVGAYNNGFGTYALDNLTIGDFNSGFGQSSLSDVVSGSYNSGFGAYSLINFEGSGGTAIGYRALYNPQTASDNVAIGDVALEPEPPAGLEVIKKLVAAGPLPAAVKVTVAVVDPVCVAVPIVGALGTAGATDCKPAIIFNI